jgi:Leucine-rich repeat (LRR) protein
MLSRLERLDLENNRLATLAPNLLDPLVQLQTLNLGSNQLGALDPNLFQLTTNLRTLTLANNQLTSIPSTLFNGLSALHTLSLANNRLDTLPPGIFAGLDQLNHLALTGNRLTTLDPRLFNSLNRLLSLALSENQLRSLDPGLLSPLYMLSILNLGYNQLVTLPPGLFDGQLTLSNIYLNDNRLSTLPPGLFNGLRCTDLHIYANPNLMFTLDNLPHENNIGFIDTMRTFAAYECRTPVAEIYQFAAHGGDPALLRSRINALEDPVKNAIFRMVYEEAGCPETNDSSWGEHHLLDNMQILQRALKRHVREKFEALSDAQKNTVYGQIYTLALQEGERAADFDFIDPQWGETHARDNILRLIDAVYTQIS